MRRNGVVMDIHIIDKLSIRSFKEEHKDDIEDIEDYEVKAALFLTYSIEPKVILAILDSLFLNTGFAEKRAAGQMITDICQELMTDEDNAADIDKERNIKERAAFLYQDGRGVDNPSLYERIAMSYAYSVRMTGSKRASFHPKIYIVQYGSSNDVGRVIYRITVGSKNLSTSNSLEHGVCYELVGEKYPDYGKENGNGADCWSWLDNIINAKEIEENAINILSSYGIRYNNESDMQLGRILKRIKAYKLIDYSGEKHPEIITAHFNDSIKLDNVDSIFSPFITKKQVEAAVKHNIKIYTLRSELERRGYEIVTEAGTGDIPFYVFNGDTDANIYSFHCKLYECRDCIYTGSLNFTDSAYNRNKEVIARLQKDDSVIAAIKRLKAMFFGQPLYYRYNKNKAEAIQKLQEILESIVDIYWNSNYYELDIKASTLYLLHKKDIDNNPEDGSLETDRKAYNKENYELTALLEKYKQYYIEIVPEGEKMLRKSFRLGQLADDKDKCFELEWEFRNMLDIKGCGITFYLCDEYGNVRASYMKHFEFNNALSEDIRNIEKRNEVSDMSGILWFGTQSEGNTGEIEEASHNSRYFSGNIAEIFKIPALENILAANNRKHAIEICNTRNKLLYEIIKGADSIEKQSDSDEGIKDRLQKDFYKKMGIQLSDIKKMKMIYQQNKKMLKKLEMYNEMGVEAHD